MVRLPSQLASADNVTSLIILALHAVAMMKQQEGKRRVSGMRWGQGRKKDGEHGQCSGAAVQ